MDTVAPREQARTGVIIAGYAFAVLMPLVGFIIGLTQINRSRHGLWIVLLSIAVFIAFFVLIIAGADQAVHQTQQEYRECFQSGVHC